MSKIKKIEELLEGWKAVKQEREEDGHTKVVIEYKGMIRGLTAALRILDEPSNTQMQIDTKPCAFCTPDLCSSIDKFCSQCGRVLND